MAKYNLERNKEKEALENLKFVTNTANIHGFIPEQIDNRAYMGTPECILMF